MAAIFHNDWAPILQPQLDLPYYKQLRAFLIEQYASVNVYPNKYDIFNALHFTSYADTKVVIIGQDPYHGAGQAHGLSFSVQRGVKLPPSLVNIFKELQDDLGVPMAQHGDLSAWAKQGVLLLNSVLTVQDGLAASHQGKGWEKFTDAVIEALNDREQPLVFILWGKHAQQKAAKINRARHHVIESVHPSPLSAHRGFFGSKPFSKANAFLEQHQLRPIDWQLPAHP